MEATTKPDPRQPVPTKPKVEWASSLIKFLESTGSFDRRQLTEMQFAMAYDTDFDHGTDGHSRLKLIARLVLVIDWMRIKVLHESAKAGGEMVIGAVPDLEDFLAWRAANSVPDPLK